MQSKLFSLFITFCLLWSSQVWGQKFLSDTVFIDFHPDTLITIGNIGIRKISDQRKEDPRFIRYYTQTRYLLFPVDEEMLLHKPLSEAFIQDVAPDYKTESDSLVIKKFRVEKQSYRFSSSTVLTADILLYTRTGDSVNYKGTFFYDYVYQPEKKKETVSEITENLLSKWHTQFKLDMLGIKAAGVEEQAGNLNFIRDPAVKSLYLNSLATTFVGLNWWGVQGELYFTRPETDRTNRIQSTLVRYQNNKLYQSFAFGRKAEHINNRLNKNLSFDADLNILLGLCKWKNVRTEKPTLYQVFDINLSSIQTLEYNPVNQNSFLFRIGLIENLQYVVKRSPQFQYGLVLSAGYKF